MPKAMHVLKGLLYELSAQDEPIIHFLLAVKSDYMFTIDRNNPDLSKFALFLSTDFSNKVVFGNMYSKLHKDLIKPLQETGLPVIIVNDIASWCYKNSLPKLKFDTISKREDYLQTFNNKIPLWLKQ